MKKFLCILLTVVFIIGITGCSQDNVSKENSNYYSIMEEQKNNLVFNLNLDEFVENFNEKTEEGKNSLESDDFDNIGTGALFFNPIESERYSTNLGSHSMVVGMSDDNLTGVMLMTKSQENVTDLFMTFSYTLEALNPEFSTEEASELAVELINTSNSSNQIYRKGMVIYVKITNSNIIFGAEAVTEEQYNQTIGTE